jgi:hypothetical protein
MLFAKEEDVGVRLGSSFWNNSDKVTPEENLILTAPFTEEEIKEAVFGMLKEPLGLKGYPSSFTKSFGISSKMI